MADEVGLIEQLYEDFAQGDVAAVLQRFSDDIEWSSAEGSPYWTGRPAVGPQEVVEKVLGRLATDYDDFTVHVERLVGLGPTVLMQGRYSARTKATGRSLDAQVAHVWDIRDDKVVRFQQYVDTAQVREVLGV